MANERNCALVVGGSSGLGLEIAKRLQATHSVIITGRTNPQEETLQFEQLYLGAQERALANVTALFGRLPHIDTFVYAAGKAEKGSLTDLSFDEIAETMALGATVPALMIQTLLLKQGALANLIVITSTSQYIARAAEPIYATSKAALGMLAHCISKDKRVGKTMVAAPAGMNTRFWRNTDRDTKDFLDPVWVAGQVLEMFDSEFSYCEMRILRDPSRIEVVASH